MNLKPNKHELYLFNRRKEKRKRERECVMYLEREKRRDTEREGGIASCKI